MDKLTKSQKKALLRHSKHHTSKHMKLMKDLMGKGSSFTKSHSAAQKQVGK